VKQAPSDHSTPTTEALITEICDRFLDNKPIRRTLPMEGRLHIDRALPFICVYRQPPGNLDTGTQQLVTGEASYLVVSGERRYSNELKNLVGAIAKTAADKFGAFLIIEIWTSRQQKNRGQNGELPPQPGFRIITSKSRPPTAAIEAFQASLKRIRLLKQKAVVEVVSNRKRAPAGLPMLMASTEARQLGGYLIGLELDPIYHDPDTGQLYPVLHRNLHRQFSRALKQAFFEFARTQTNYAPTSHHALGRRAVVRAVWDVDRQLAKISNSFDFLLQVTPVNINQAWQEFKRRKFEKPPVLYYRPVPVDPAALKFQLYQIGLERVEDPTLALLFRQKRTELDRQLTMLGDRGNKQFLYGSLQLFGGVSPSLYQLADTLLQRISPRSHEKNGKSIVNAKTFAGHARAELEYYRALNPQFTATAQLRDDTVGLMVSRGQLLIGRDLRVPKSRVEALLQHEVGTHILTYFNGSQQPFQQLYAGLAGYEELQEGLAVLSEYLVGGLSRQRLRLLAGRVVATQHLIDGASFIETFEILYKQYRFTRQTAFIITVRIYRGGGFSKDAVYLRGLVDVLNYLQQGGQLEPLFVGKIAAKHVSIIQELQARQVLRPVSLFPPAT
jgi:uncharacterized protein (TIGR02421 family)